MMPRLHNRGFYAFLLAYISLMMIFSACSSGSQHAVTNANDSIPVRYPGLNEVWQISTHNSYWVDRGVRLDFFASGTEERILDQLLADHVRSIEIDIHPDLTTRHHFRVYHTRPGNSLCDPLESCLEILRLFHYALPQHEVLHITLELKGIAEPTFDETHTIEDLDQILTTELGDMLYRPIDFLQRCDNEGTLGSCARSTGWPELDELRRRFIVSVLGNWDELCNAQNTKDWARYALAGDIRERAAFPMASSWKLDWNRLSAKNRALLSQEELDMAFEQSIYMQVENLEDPYIEPFLLRDGIIRIDGAFDMHQQEMRILLGMQMLQTDFPWIQYNDRGPAEPFRPFPNDISYDFVREPGQRLFLYPANVNERIFAYEIEPATSTAFWETIVSSGTDTNRVGCLRAAASLGQADENSVTVCRTKPVKSDMAIAEGLIIRLGTCRIGECDWEDFPSANPSGDGPQDLIALYVNSQENGLTCVNALAASVVDRDLKPQWLELGEKRCFAMPLPYQGIARPTMSENDVEPTYFFGTKRDGALGSGYMRATDFTSIIIEPPVEAGGGPSYRFDPTKLEDASS